VSNLVSYFEECNLRVFEDQMLKRIFECKRRKLQEDLKKSVLGKKLCQIPTVPVVYDAEDHTILNTSAVYLALVVAQGDRRWLRASIRWKKNVTRLTSRVPDCTKHFCFL